MKEIFYVALLFTTLLVFALAGYLWQSAQDDREMYHRWIGEMRQEMYVLRGRLENLENVRVQIDLRDHTGLWFVADVQEVEK